MLLASQRVVQCKLAVHQCHVTGGGQISFQK